MVDYSQFVFHDRDHSYGYAEEVSVVSLPDYCPYDASPPGSRQALYPVPCYTRPVMPLEACQDLPLNLSLNNSSSPTAQAGPAWDSVPVESAGSTSSSLSGEIESLPAGSRDFSTMPELGSLFIVPVSDLGAHIAQEEIVESEVMADGEENDTDEEDSSSSSQEEEEEEDDILQHAFNHETSRNTHLRAKVTDLTKKITRIRAMLEAAAQTEKNTGTTDQQAVICPPPQSSAHSVSSRVSVFTVTAESDLEIKSEGELDSAEMVPGLRAMKRSRNQSWPQMLDSNARKKEQNKMASKRFRERKKQELEKARQEILELEAKNELLRHKADKMQREADCLKEILVRLKLIRIVEYASGNSTIQRI